MIIKFGNTTAKITTLKGANIAELQNKYVIVVQADDGEDMFIVFRSSSKHECEEVLKEFMEFYEKGAPFYEFPASAL